ncbi:MAG TPA: hypothetical protein VK978_04655 [Candidatus Saccharimonadales bacterium]|nr:hypothetical protein [Candidatus Saccharimonadales bacterium]
MSTPLQSIDGTIVLPEVSAYTTITAHADQDLLATLNTLLEKTLTDQLKMRFQHMQHSPLPASLEDSDHPTVEIKMTHTSLGGSKLTITVKATLHRKADKGAFLYNLDSVLRLTQLLAEHLDNPSKLLEDAVLQA